MGSGGKNFGSMNMDEFLKNIWIAEKTQGMASSSVRAGGGVPGMNLQRLPRTLSQKTVEEVWKDLFKETSGCKDGSSSGRPNLQQRQRTLGEMTLEGFLVRAGVVREDIQSIGQTNNAGIFGAQMCSNNNTGLGLGFPQPSQNNGINREQ